MTRASAAIALALLATAAGAGPAAPAAAEEVNVVYTGHTGGAGSGASSASTLSILTRALQAGGGSAAVEKAGPGVLALGGELLLEPAGLRRQPLVRLLAQPGAALEGHVLVERLAALEGEHDLTFQYPPDPGLELLPLVEARNRQTRDDPTLHRVEVRLLEVRTTSGARVLRIVRATAQREPATGPLAWEGLRAARGAARRGDRTATFYSVFKALGAGPRRVRLVEQVHGELPAGTALLVSGGDEVSTADPLRPGRTSPLRGLDFAALSHLGYAAVLPGARELYFGLGELREQLARAPLPIVATNLRAKNKQGGPGAAPFPRYLVLRLGSARVCVLGLLSPDLAAGVRGPEVLSDLAVGDAAQAAGEALAEARGELGGEPDLVVALSALKGAAAADYLSRAQGVDLFIGDFGDAGLHGAGQIVDGAARLRNLGAERRPLLRVSSSPLRVGQVRVELAADAGRLAIGRMVDRQTPVLAELPRDEALQRQLAALAGEDLELADLPLVPSLDELENPGPAARDGRAFTPRLWSQLAVNLLRASSDAEIAVIRAPAPLAGQDAADQVEPTAAGWLSAEDPLVACDLTGAQLKGLAFVVGETALFSGLDVEKLLVAGRPLNDTERYRVIAAAPLLAAPAAERLLRGVETRSQLHLLDGRLAEDARGRTVRLGEVVVAVLRERRGEADDFAPAYLDQLRRWLSPQGSALEPRWSLGVEDLALSLTGYANGPGNAWVYNQGVRDARATTPNNFAALFKGTLFATWDSPAWTWDNRVIAALAYNVLKLNASPGLQDLVSKPEDDLWLSSELRCNRLPLVVGPGEGLRFVPYVTAAYDTEFTVTTDLNTGATYPRREDLFASVGLVTSPREVVKLLRVGGIGRANLAAGRAHVDGGLLVATRLELMLAPSRLQLGSRLRYFARTSGDTPDQLGFILESSAKLLFPLTRDLAFSLGVDLFVYRAKLREAIDLATGEPFQRGTSLSVITSAGLTFEHLWKP